MNERVSAVGSGTRRPGARRPTWRPVGLAALALCAVLALPGTAPGQEVRGTLIAEESGEPLSGAYVVLQDSTGARVVAGLSTEEGTFRLRAPGPGRYLLRVERIGYRTWESGPFRLELGDVRGGEYRISVSPVRLSELRVRSERVCATDPEEGTVAAALREEALKALEAVRWTRRARPYVFSVVRRVRVRDPDNFDILSQEESRSDSVAGALPFASLPVGRLQEEGYVQERGDTTVYYGPDDDVLLSDRFWAEHCFETVPGSEGDGLIGLSFRPVPGREKPDIQGVIWMDRDSVFLRRVEFGYTRTGTRATGEYLGGELRFRRLPSGGWILDRWALRIPISGRTQPGLLGLRSQGGLEQTMAIREFVGEVTGITQRYASVAGARASEGVTVAGIVYDSVSGGPLAGARVILPEAGLAERTDEGGSYQLSHLPAGEHRIEVDHSMYRALGLEPPSEEVWTRPDRYYRVTIRLPSRETLLQRTCGQGAEEGTVVAGRIVRAGSGEPVSRARILLQARSAAAEETTRPGGAKDTTGAGAARTSERLLVWEARSGDGGFYRLCGVPRDAELSVRVMADGHQTYRGSVSTAGAVPFWRHDLTLQPSSPGDGP